MNILLLTHDSVLATYIENLIRVSGDINILTDSTYVNKNEIEIDVLILDEYKEEIEIVLKQLKLNLLTPTILLQDYLYNCPTSCEECIKKFNRKALLKPFKIKTLFNTLNNFELTRCNYYNFYHNTKFLPELLENFKYYTFNAKTNSILLLNEGITDNNYREFLEIVEMLDRYKFKFTVENQKILIH